MNENADQGRTTEVRLTCWEEFEEKVSTFDDPGRKLWDEVWFRGQADARWALRTTVCTENSVRIDLVTESPNVSDDGRAVMLLPDAVRRAVQVEEPT